MTTTTIAPEKCPVCGAGTLIDVHLAREFECHAIWSGYSGHAANRWTTQCPHAMTAALRCGATLAPTPAELAREALVAALDRWYKSWKSGVDLPTQQAADPNVKNVWVDSSDDALFKAYAAYLAATQEPQ